MKSNVTIAAVLGTVLALPAVAADNADVTTRYRVDTGLQATPGRALGPSVAYRGEPAGDNLDPATRYDRTTGWSGEPAPTSGYVLRQEISAGSNADPLTRYGVNHGL